MKRRTLRRARRREMARGLAARWEAQYRAGNYCSVWPREYVKAPGAGASPEVQAAAVERAHDLLAAIDRAADSLSRRLCPASRSVRHPLVESVGPANVRIGRLVKGARRATERAARSGAARAPDREG